MTFTARWFALFAAGSVPLALSWWAPGLALLAIPWNGLLLAAAIADYLLLPPWAAIEVSRRVEAELSLGEDNPVRVEVANRSKWQWNITLHDEPPPRMPTDHRDAAAVVAPGRRHTTLYHVRPRARGDYRFGDVWVRVRGRLGLVARIGRFPAEQEVKVYPNLRATARFTLMARRGRLQQLGIRAARLAGAGREFESLRDHQPDDDIRRIDWKATARRGRLVSREYQVERSQNVLLALDLGRTMLAEIDGIAKLDYALNAALLLATVASLSDDRVGLLAFSDTVRAWIAPARGRGQVCRILQALYNVRAERVEPDYEAAFAWLAGRWRRRSLVVAFTDLWDPESSRQTISQLASLQPRHLVACVTLLDSLVPRLASAPLRVASDAFERAVALQVLEDRERAAAELRRRGVLVVDSPADRLSADLVNRYLEVKERMLL